MQLYDGLVMINPDSCPPLNPDYRANVEAQVRELQLSGIPFFVVEGMRRGEVTDFLLREGAENIPRLDAAFRQVDLISFLIGKSNSKISVALGGTYEHVYELGRMWCYELETNHVGTDEVARPNPRYQLAKGFVLDKLV